MAFGEGDMQQPRPFWQWLFDNVWLWLLLSNLIFFIAYVVWGVLDVTRVPAR
jgi:hypothetical protein